MSDETARVQAITQRLKDATPGPWKAENFTNTFESVTGQKRTIAMWHIYEANKPGDEQFDLTDDITAGDAQFIAHAPTDIAWLLEQNARLEAVVALSRKAVEADNLIDTNCGESVDMTELRAALKKLDAQQAGKP